MKNIYKLLTIFVLFEIAGLLLLKSVSARTIIFQTNFDHCDNWSITQGPSDISNIYPSYIYGKNNFPSDHPASSSGPKYIGWFDSKTYLRKNLHNTVTLSSRNCRSGKCITHYSEVPLISSGGEASGGELYISLTDPPGQDDTGYEEIWITVWRKFQPNYYTNQNMQKFIRVSHFNANSPYGLTSWHPKGDPDSHAPFVIGGFNGANGLDNYGYKLRYGYFAINLYPYANRSDYKWSPSDLNCGLYHSAAGSKVIYTWTRLRSGTQHGGWQQPGNYGDGNYHIHEYHFKMNSSPGLPDGVLEYYIDGICQVSLLNIPYIKSGLKMLKWNLVALGGNNDFYDPNGEYECYYAYDDVVISDYRIGKDYKIP